MTGGEDLEEGPAPPGPQQLLFFSAAESDDGDAPLPWRRHRLQKWRRASGAETRWPGGGGGASIFRRDVETFPVTAKLF